MHGRPCRERGTHRVACTSERCPGTCCLGRERQLCRGNSASPSDLGFRAAGTKGTAGLLEQVARGGSHSAPVWALSSRPPSQDLIGRTDGRNQ